ncbi:MAG: helix-hairpin-helix domain-containing protein [Polaromonas sp.]
MFKKFLAFFAAMYMAVSFAAVDVNKATAADLDGIKGIGPGISGKIVDERKKGEFKDWNDFIERVKGIGDKNAAKFSAEGMTVGGASYKGAAPAAKKDVKPASAKAEEKKAEGKAAATSATVAAAPAAAMAKDDKKAKAEEAKAKADAKKASKADAKKAGADEKADAAKPAASTPKK